MSKRSPQKDHEELIPYYSSLLEKINKITSNYGTEREECDPVVEKMLEDLQMEIIRDGKLELTDIGCYNKREWLCALKKKIECKLQAAEDREATLNNIEQFISERETDEITFLDLSTAIKSPKVDPILAEAARDRPSDYHITSLKNNYSWCIVKIFLQLLEQEKLYIINQERITYQNFVTSLRQDLLDEVRRGITKYVKARQEWKRVSIVMRKLESERNRILKEIKMSSIATDPDFREKEQLIDQEIETAKNRLEDAQSQNDSIDEKISKLHEQIHQLTSEFQRLDEDGKRETDFLLKENADLQSQVASQQRKLIVLKHKVSDKDESECMKPNLPKC